MSRVSFVACYCVLVLWVIISRVRSGQTDTRYDNNVVGGASSFRITPRLFLRSPISLPNEDNEQYKRRLFPTGRLRSIR